MPVVRRLAAILAADVAGYSQLMGADEEGTLARLMSHRRSLVDPKIAEHHGRIVKTTGDGLLVEFPSAVDAVRSAVEVQRGMAERNAPLSIDQRIEFRIGINLGDVIVEGDDIYGDGVNVAARLEALAERGGVFISISCTRRFATGCPLILTTLANSGSRTSHAWYASTVFRLPTTPRLKRRGQPQTNHRSLFCHSRT